MAPPYHWSRSHTIPSLAVRCDCVDNNNNLSGETLTGEQMIELAANRFGERTEGWVHVNQRTGLSILSRCWLIISCSIQVVVVKE